MENKLESISTTTVVEMRQYLVITAFTEDELEEGCQKLIDSGWICNGSTMESMMLSHPFGKGFAKLLTKPSEDVKL